SAARTRRRSRAGRPPSARGLCRRARAGRYATAADARSYPAMSPTEADDEATHDDTEPDDEELSEQDEQDIKRLDIALTTLDDESLRRGLSGITEKQRQELATQLNLPRATIHLGDALAPLVRRK